METFWDIVEISYYIDVELPGDIAVAGGQAAQAVIDWISSWF